MTYKKSAEIRQWKMEIWEVQVQVPLCIKFIFFDPTEKVIRNNIAGLDELEPFVRIYDDRKICKNQSKLGKNGHILMYPAKVIFEYGKSVYFFRYLTFRVEY